MAPPAAALLEILSATTRTTRRADIYEADGVTPWLLDAPILGGSVGVDSSRDEWRHLEVTLANLGGALDNYPGGLWYDKVVKVFRGVLYEDGGFGRDLYGDGAYGSLTYGADTQTVGWEVQLCECIIDEISTQDFPHQTNIKGRDYAAKLLTDEFGEATTFAQGTNLVDVIEAIAINGGITKFVFPQTGQVLGKDFSFESATSRWKAITDLATAYGYQVFFDAQGYMVMREFRDPATSALVFTFVTGFPDGTLATFKKVANQTRLYNAVEVTGQASDQSPVFAMAENHEPSSPTSIENLRRRKVYRYSSPFISTAEQALDVATKFLPVVGLESFELAMESLVLFWLEAGEIVGFVDPDPNPGDPTRFLLTDFDIPLDLSPMRTNAKRVQVVS